MEKHCSDRPSKLITENQREKPYKDIWENLNEWFALYYEYVKSKKIFFNKAMLRKYKLIRKILKRDFGNDMDLKEYIKKLPSPWILKPWVFERIAALCFILFNFGNNYIFNIYIGVELIGRVRGTFDVIYIYINILISVIYLYMFHRREKAFIAIKENLLQIRDIAWRKL